MANVLARDTDGPGTGARFSANHDERGQGSRAMRMKPSATEVVVIALGSNLGDRRAILARAVDALRRLAAEGSVRVSPVVETIAMTHDGPDPDRPGYLNQVVELRTSLPPDELLHRLHAVEDSAGRERSVVWGDRTLDLDLIAYGTRVIRTRELTVPHPRAAERDFVLVPWSMLDPDAVLPGSAAISDLIRALRDVTVVEDGPAQVPLGPGAPTDGVLRRVLPSWLDPETVYLTLIAPAPHHVWRDRGIDAVHGVSFMGRPGDTSDVLIVDEEMRRAGRGGVLSAVTGTMSDRLRGVRAESSTLGWWGWLGYELCSESVDVRPPRSANRHAVQLFVDRGIEFDHEAGTVTAVVLASAADADDWLKQTATHLTRQQGDPVIPVGSAPEVRVRWRHDRARYLRMIEACKDVITRGDAYQICLTNRAAIESDSPVDPADVIRRLRRSSPAPQAGVVRSGDSWIISSSPEDFLRVDPEGHASTSPIKGTRRRSADDYEDARLRAELRASVKERAENLMIVDLMRNDLSRISRTGTVEVTRMFGIDSFAAVHQLVSTIEADLLIDAPRALASLVPPGSMTGAPKRSAVEHLLALEAGPRGAYSGVWGRSSVDGSADIGVLIRTIEVDGREITIGSGGGITAMSEPAEEWDEVMLKAGPLLAAVGCRPADPERQRVRSSDSASHAR